MKQKELEMKLNEEAKTKEAALSAAQRDALKK